jgi:hypothetical protein
MGGSFNWKEPNDINIIHQYHEVLTILENCHWLEFFEKLRGFDDEAAMEFALNLQNLEGKELVTIIIVLVIYIKEDSISKITTLHKGMHWNKEER